MTNKKVRIAQILIIYFVEILRTKKKRIFEYLFLIPKIISKFKRIYFSFLPNNNMDRTQK